MRIVSVEARPWTLSLRAPFAIARRTAYAAHNVRIAVRTDDLAVVGWGESAPVAYVTGETVPSVQEAVAQAAPLFAGQDAGRLGPLWAKASEALPDAPSARAGLEMALADAWGKHWRMPLWQHFGGMARTLATDITIPLVSPTQAGILAAEAWRDGFRALKIKVGDPGGHEADLARIAAIVRAAPLARLRIDANQAFAPDDAVSFARHVLSTGALVDLLEQPVAKEDVPGLKYVRERVSVPVFADEAACDMSHVLRLLREDAVDGVNVKLMKSGLAGAGQIVALCRAWGKKLMLGCMLESGLGIAAAAQMAGGLGAFDYLDLDSHQLLSPIAGLSGGFACRGGALTVGDENGQSAGWGVAVPEFLEEKGPEGADFAGT